MFPTLVELLRDWLTRNNLYRWVMIFDQREFRVLAAALVSFGIVLFFGKRVIRWLTAKKIGDQAKFDVKENEFNFVLVLLILRMHMHRQMIITIKQEYYSAILKYLWHAANL